jgi:hypothetical protein
MGCRLPYAGVLLHASSKALHVRAAPIKHRCRAKRGHIHQCSWHTSTNKVYNARQTSRATHAR